MATDDSSNEQEHQCEPSDEAECGLDRSSEHEEEKEEEDGDERGENDYSPGTTEVLLASHTFGVGKTLVDVETHREIPAWQGKLIFGAIFAIIVAIGVAIAVNSN